MHENSRDAGLVSGAQHLDCMAIVGMHAAAAKERNQMQAALLRCAQCAAQARHLRK